MPSLTFSIPNGQSTSTQSLGSLQPNFNIQTVLHLNGSLSPDPISLYYNQNVDLIFDASLFNSWPGGVATLRRLSLLFCNDNMDKELSTTIPLRWRNAAPPSDPVFDLVTQNIPLVPPQTTPHYAITAINQITFSLQTIAAPSKPVPTLSFRYALQGLLSLPKGGTNGVAIPFILDPRMIITDGP
jgi:hypothetical protein